METFIYFNEGDDAHFDLEEDNHPEKPARTRRILKTLKESGVLEKCIEKNSERVATDEEIRMVHTKKMLDHLKKTETMKDEELMEEAEKEFNSIFLTRDTLKVARKAVGAVLEVRNIVDKFKLSFIITLQKHRCSQIKELSRSIEPVLFGFGVSFSLRCLLLLLVLIIIFISSHHELCSQTLW